LAFLDNHREEIVAFDFLTVPTVTFRLLYCFFVIEHGRRKILRFNVTRHLKQLRAFDGARFDTPLKLIYHRCQAAISGRPGELPWIELWSTT
jgi:hypothetical protein